MTLAPHLDRWTIAVFVIGLFGTYALVARRVPGALVVGILGTTALAMIINAAKGGSVWSDGVASWPDKLAASASSNTTFIESSAGVEEGGRTGLASVVTGLFFLLCLFLSPLAGSSRRRPRRRSS